MQPVKQVSNRYRACGVTLAVFLNLFPTFASAENPYISTSQVLGFVTTDLTGSGRNDRIVLYNLEDAPSNTVVLSIWNRGDNGEWGNSVFAEYIAQNNGVDREPTLALAQNGSVEIHSFSLANDPKDWEKTLTIAYRHLDGFTYPEYLVVGVKLEWNNDGNANDRRACDLNLLTGVAEITHRNNNKMRRSNIEWPPETIDAWPRDMIPQSCF